LPAALFSRLYFVSIWLPICLPQSLDTASSTAQTSLLMSAAIPPRSKLKAAITDCRHGIGANAISQLGRGLGSGSPQQLLWVHRAHDPHMGGRSRRHTRPDCLYSISFTTACENPAGQSSGRRPTVASAEGEITFALPWGARYTPGDS